MNAAITISISLLAHTNVGKTTLARTLLGREIGEVRDSPHVTELSESHELIATADGERLLLWDTPGFGDSVRLAARMRQSGTPVGWLLSQVWDRWRDRGFWSSQQALRHVRETSDVVLYLVSAAEPQAGWLAAEMELLAWTGKPVLALLNQMGEPRATEAEQAEVQAWRERLARWPFVREVLPLDAFARCWVHEATLLAALQRVLPAEQLSAFQRLATAWRVRQEQRFDEAIRVLAHGLAQIACLREPLEPASGLIEKLRGLGQRVAGQPGGAETAAVQRLHVRLAELERSQTAELLQLHGLHGEPVARIHERVAHLVQAHRKVDETQAALWGGALTGALAGLKADLATGGLTLGGGLLAGGLLGALGGAGLARGINRLRGTDSGWVGLSAEALRLACVAALLRYLAVAHFGRGRGGWEQGEAPAHWPAAVSQALELRNVALGELLRDAARHPAPDAAIQQQLGEALLALLAPAARGVLAALYPPSDNPPP